MIRGGKKVLYISLCLLSNLFERTVDQSIGNFVEHTTNNMLISNVSKINLYLI